MKTRNLRQESRPNGYDAKHSEAYGRSQKEGQAILEGKISDDSELLGDTMAYKGNHWNNKGSTGGGLEDNTFEVSETCRNSIRDSKAGG